MGLETRSFADASTDLGRVAQAVADTMVRERGFQLKLKARTDDGYVLKLDKSDFGRQLAGLVYTLDVTLRRDDGRVTVTVDDGDIRNQLLALGLGVFLPMLWPLLLTAGYGWITKGDARGQVIAIVARELGAAA
jgi:hypothetical protein